MTYSHQGMMKNGRRTPEGHTIVYTGAGDKDSKRTLRDDCDMNQMADKWGGSVSAGSWDTTSGRGNRKYIVPLNTISGILMAANFLWLNKRMDLKQPSATMNLVRLPYPPHL